MTMNRILGCDKVAHRVFELSLPAGSFLETGGPAPEKVRSQWENIRDQEEVSPPSTCFLTCHPVNPSLRVTSEEKARSHQSILISYKSNGS